MGRVESTFVPGHVLQLNDCANRAERLPANPSLRCLSSHSGAAAHAVKGVWTRIRFV